MLPWLNGGFYYNMQLTLAAVARLAMETVPPVQVTGDQSKQAVTLKPSILRSTGR